MRYVLVTICFIILTLNLGKWGLAETSEARYAQIAKEMYESKDYLHPTLLNIYHYHKPPLTYYITTLGYQLFGVNEFGARFFLQVAFIVQLILIFKISFLIFENKKVALLSSLIYFATPAILISIRNLTTDAYLNTFVIACIYFWLLSIKKKPNFIYLFYFTLGLGFLTKGPLVFLPVIVFVLVWKSFNKTLLKYSYRDFIGIILLLLVSGWWYLLVYKDNPDLYDYFLNNQIANRINGKNAFNRGKPFWFYLLVVPLAGLPWLPFIIAYFKKTIANKPLKVFNYSSLFLIFIFSLFSTKLILYIIPAYALLSITAGKLLFDSTDIIKTRFYKTALVFAIIVGIAIVIAPFFTEDITLSIGVRVFFVGIIVLGILLSKMLSPVYKGSVIIVSFSCALLLISPFIMNANASKVNSIKPIAEFINSINTTNKDIYVYNDILPSIDFYTNKKSITLHTGRNTSDRETFFQIDASYKVHFYRLTDSLEVVRLKNDYRANSIIIEANKRLVKEKYSFLKDSLKHKKVFKKWTVIY